MPGKLLRSPRRGPRRRRDPDRLAVGPAARTRGRGLAPGARRRLALGVLAATIAAAATVVMVSALPRRRPGAVATTAIAGATRGGFQVAPNGAAVYQIPISVPPGTHGMQPGLSLLYSSQQGDGPVGVGWSLAGLPSIGRCGASILQDGFRGGVAYDANDRFCLQASGVADGRLVPADAEQPSYFVPGAAYRTEKETWTNVVASTSQCGSGPCSFQVTLRDGTSLGFGTSASGQVAAVAATTASPPPAGSIRAWLLTQMTDLDGNSLQITYAGAAPTLSGPPIASTGTAYPVRIDYTSRAGSPAMSPMRSVQFYYSPRSDGSDGFQGGAMFQDAALLTTIQTCIATSTGTPVSGLSCSASGLQLVKQYNLTYGQHPTTNQSRLVSVQECDGAGGCFPPTVAAWSDGPDGLAATPVPSTSVSNNSGWIADYNGDGLTDLLSLQVSDGCPGDATATLYFASGQGFTLPGTCVTIPITQYQYQYAGDFNGDGLADLLLANTTGGVIYYSTGAGFGATGTAVNVALDAQSWVGDVNGDGMADLVTAFADSGSIYLSTGTGLGAAIAFGGAQLQQGQTWMVDFNGDGMADLFSAGPSSGTLYLSTGSTFAAGIAVTGLELVTGSTWVGDFNGDGLPDLLSAAGSTGYLSYANGAGFQAPLAISGMQLQQGQTWIADFNGDGLMDLYSAGSVSGTIYYATRGGGFTSATAPGQFLQANATWLGDFNGDGAADLYAPGSGSDTIYFASQGGTVQTSSQAPDQILTITDGIGGQTSITYLPLTSGAVYTRQAQPSSQQLDLLLAASPFQYAPLSPVQVPIYGDQVIENPLYVVASYTLQNAPAQNTAAYSYTYNYFYTQSLFNLLGRGWLGFASVTSADVALGATTTTDYRQDFPYDGEPATRAVCESGGSLAPCLTQGQGGSPLAVTSYSYECQDTQTFAACVIADQQDQPGATVLFQVLVSQEQDLDTSYGSTVETDYSYDDYGNATLISSLGDIQHHSHPVYTCQSFSNSVAPWAIGYLQYRKISSSSSCSDGLEQWNPATDLRLGQLQYDSRWNVTAELGWDDQSSSWLGTQYTYDDYGNQTTDTVLSGSPPVAIAASTYTTRHDAVYHTFPVSRSTPTPDPEDASSKPLVTGFAYDARFGAEVAVEDPNGHITNTCLDSFGRVIATQGPTPRASAADANCLTSATYPYLDATYLTNQDTAVLAQVVWSQDAAAGTFTRETLQRNSWGASSSWLRAVNRLDGLKRSRRMTTATDGGAPAHVDREYLTPALVKRISLPYLEGAAVSWITEQHDAEGRVVKRMTPYQAPDGSVSTSEVRWRYSAPSTITETQVENTGASYVVRSSFEYYSGQKKTVTSVVHGDGDATTRLGYDLLGSLTSATSPRGAGTAGAVVNRVQYDSLGRRIAYEETNTGKVTFHYNTWGALDQQKDAKGQRTEVVYDDLLRPTQRTMLDAGGDLALRDVYAYDVPAADRLSNVRGELSGVTVSDAGGAYLSYAFGYDPYAGETERVVSFPRAQQSYSFSTRYDPQRRTLSRRYPDPPQSVVSRRYSPAAGNLAQVAYANAGAPSPQPYLTLSSYTPFYLPQQIQYQNGDVQRLTYDVSGKLLSSTLEGASSTVLGSMVYGWDTLDNLVSMLDCNYQGNSGNAACQAIGVAGTSQTDLGQSLTLVSNRLTQAIGPFGDGQAQSTLGYGYDQAGNLIQSGGVTYSYAGHQPVSGTAGGAQVFQAVYDANGNLCYKALGSTAIRSCPAPSTAPSSVTTYINTVDAADRISAVQKDNLTLESYLYDHEGRRVQKTLYAPDGVTVASTIYYVTPDFEVTVPAVGSPQYTLYLPGMRPRAVAMDDPGTDAGAVSYLQKDAVDSTVMVTGSDGTVGSQIVYEPYGTPSSITPPGSAPWRTMFQGKELDSTGMYYFGARYHDPVLGRFASADTIPAGSTYAQDALNRYAFALDNPARYTDPSGHLPVAILTIIFQAIFDTILGPEAAPEVEAAVLAAQRLGVADEQIFAEMSTNARRALAATRRDVSARAMAQDATDALRRANAIGRRQKLSVIITDRAIYSDVSGAADLDDVLTPRTGLTDQMNARRLDAEREARYATRGRWNSFETWSVRNCAEFRACNQMVRNGEQIDDIREMNTVSLRNAADAPRCRNCRLTLGDVRLEDITSDPAPREYRAFARENPIERPYDDPRPYTFRYRSRYRYRPYP